MCIRRKRSNRKDLLKFIDYLKKKCNTVEDVKVLGKDIADNDKNIICADESGVNNVKISAHIIWIMGIQTFIYSIIVPLLIMIRTYDYSDFERMVINACLFIVVIIILIITLIYNYLWYKKYNFCFVKNSLVVKEGVISTKESHLFYDRIQQVDTAQGLIGRMIGLYSVRVESAGEISGLSFVFPSLKQADAQIITDYLKDKSKKFKKV